MRRKIARTVPLLLEKAEQAVTLGGLEESNVVRVRAA